MKYRACRSSVFNFINCRFESSGWLSVGRRGRGRCRYVSRRCRARGVTINLGDVTVVRCRDLSDDLVVSREADDRRWYSVEESLVVKADRWVGLVLIVAPALQVKGLAVVGCRVSDVERVNVGNKSRLCASEFPRERVDSPVAFAGYWQGLVLESIACSAAGSVNYCWRWHRLVSVDSFVDGLQSFYHVFLLLFLNII